MPQVWVTYVPFFSAHTHNGSGGNAYPIGSTFDFSPVFIRSHSLSRDAGPHQLVNPGSSLSREEDFHHPPPLPQNDVSFLEYNRRFFLSPPHFFRPSPHLWGTWKNSARLSAVLKKLGNTLNLGNQFLFFFSPPIPSTMTDRSLIASSVSLPPKSTSRLSAQFEEEFSYADTIGLVSSGIKHF